MRLIGVMATTLWNFAGDDAKFLDPRRVFKPVLAGLWAEQDVPIGSGLRYVRYRSGFDGVHVSARAGGVSSRISAAAAPRTVQGRRLDFFFCLPIAGLVSFVGVKEPPGR